MASVQGSTERSHAAVANKLSSTRARRLRRAKRAVTKGTASSEKHRTTFFDLPPELRNHVYEFYFNDLLASPKHLFDELPLNTRFDQYVDLLRTSRQVHQEAESLFLSDYAHRIVFYFINATELVASAKYIKRNRAPSYRVPQGARFFLRQSGDIDEYNHERYLKDATEALFRE